MTDIYKLARPKLNGIVCDIIGGHPSDNIKNRMVRDLFTGMPSFKGTIIVGPPEAAECYERSKFMVEDETLVHPFIFWIWDIQTTHPYSLKDRLNIAESFIHSCGPVFQYVDHELIENFAALDAYHKLVVEEKKFPGVILREPYGTFGTEDEEAPETTTIQ